jgi:DNA-binding protein H-NS
MRGIEVMMQLGEIAPVADYLDKDRLIKYVATSSGIPATVLASDEEVAQLRQQQAEQAQAQAEQQQAMLEAEQLQKAAPMVKAVS